VKLTSLTQSILVIALSSAALPCAAAAGAGGTHAAISVKFAPLFDTTTRFKPHKLFKLRFKAVEAKTGAPIAKDQIVFRLRQGYGVTKETGLSAKMVKAGVFEVPFKPEGPGQYAVLTYVRGATAGEIAPVRLGVVGVSDGLVEVPASEDADVQRRAHAMGFHATR
jgi:hypothetical protein